MTNEALGRGIISDAWEYRESWLAAGGKSVAPFPVNDVLSAELAQRMISGSRTSGAEAILVGGDEPVTADDGVLALPLTQKSLRSRLAGRHSPLLMVASNQSGALLFAEPGYALIAGDEQFLGGAVAEGVDQVRAQFGRYSKSVAAEYSNSVAVSRNFPPRSISHSSAKDVPDDTGTSQQIGLMRALVAGSVTPPHFAQQWMDARRKAMVAGERTRDPLTRLLDATFSALEDYSFDPAYWEPGDLTDAQLIERVRVLVNELENT